MRYRRALFLSDPAKPPGPALAVLGRVAPELEHLLVIEPRPAEILAWLSGERSLQRDEGTSAAQERLHEAAKGLAPSIQVQFAPELRSNALAALCAAEDIDLVVLGSRSLKSASAISAPRKRLPVATLWAESAGEAGPIQHIACVSLDKRSRAAIGAFLRDHVDPSIHVALLSLTRLTPDELAGALRVAGIRPTVEVRSVSDAASIRPLLEDWMRHRSIDLLVFSRVQQPLLLSALSTMPVLLLPPLEAPKQFGQRAIDVSDLVDQGGPVRARVDHVAAVGDLASIPDQTLAFVSNGRVVATATSSTGQAELPAGLGMSSVGVYRIGNGSPTDPLAAIEQWVSVIQPGERPLVLFDSELPDQTLRALVELHGSEPLAVRLRPTRSCRSIRARLRSNGLPPRVLDARTVLDEGEALDVSVSLDSVRLARVASALRRAGFPISAIVHRGPVDPLVEGFAVLRGTAFERDSENRVKAQPSRFDGNRIQIEVDNATARRFLLEAIENSRNTLHLQVYAALDDDVGSVVEAALAEAGARGVTVRVLVDSLHGLHGSFGTQNPLLERLSGRPGVEVRISRPIAVLPSLTDLKQRDHRKLVIADGRLALLGGRNLSHEYYTGFDEVRLTSESRWREIPWLDAGARVEGPLVAVLSSSFLEAWTEAGGQPFEVFAPAPVGESTARIVIHRGLRDAHTLEAYLELIESARSHVYVVNGFPLLLEIQHALVRALGRGIRVRTLIGHLTPTHGEQLFSGPWATARSAATELVHSRMDPIVAAGGEAYLFTQRDLPGWEPGLGAVHPHVHAKAMSVDGLRCAVGSANLDITASYWESELLLVVEDRTLAREFESRIDILMAGSMPMNREDPAWRQLAKRRAWMRHWPGVLSV